MARDARGEEPLKAAIQNRECSPVAPTRAQIKVAAKIWQSLCLDHAATPNKRKVNRLVLLSKKDVIAAALAAQQ